MLAHSPKSTVSKGLNSASSFTKLQTLKLLRKLYARIGALLHVLLRRSGKRQVLALHLVRQILDVERARRSFRNVQLKKILTRTRDNGKRLFRGWSVDLTAEAM